MNRARERRAELHVGEMSIRPIVRIDVARARRGDRVRRVGREPTDGDSGFELGADGRDLLLELRQDAEAALGVARARFASLNAT